MIVVYRVWCYILYYVSSMFYKFLSICCGLDVWLSSIVFVVGFVRVGLLCVIDRCVMDLKFEFVY